VFFIPNCSQIAANSYIRFDSRLRDNNFFLGEVFQFFGLLGENIGHVAKLCDVLKKAVLAVVSEPKEVLYLMGRA
jgi:hypothetical protein